MNRMPNWTCNGLLLGLLLWSGWAHAEGIAIICHPQASGASLSSKQIADLYMGKKKAGGGNSYALYGQASLKQDFYKRLNGMSLSNVNAYWARLRFTGQVFPPKSLSSADAVVNAVRNNPNAIGFVSASAVTHSVKVIQWLN
jgi:ABC-type phosphate transport system substrate-binding protein